jgi:endo-1,4-beta-D-glucanase Y
MKKLIMLLCLSVVFQLSFSQKYPFPQNVKYAYGVKSSKISNADVIKDYEKWKQDYVRMCGETEACVIKYINNVQTTVSEGIGYGMAITVYMGDKVLYDKFLNYYVARTNKHGMMNWIYENCDSGDNQKNGATDADLDVIFSLVVATKQWPNEARYKPLVNELLDSLRKFNFIECNGIIVQKPGDDFGGCNCSNPSYYSPAYYKVFAKFKEELNQSESVIFWNKAAQDAYVTLLKNANPNTGLVYAWTNSEGKDPSDCYYEVSGSGTYNSYQYDACRTPWRISMDYLWFGDKQAETWLQKITNFVNAPVYKQVAPNGDFWYGAGGITNVVDSYWGNGLRRIDPTGVVYGHNHTIPFVGSFALASMVSNQSKVDEGMTDFNVLPATTYYQSCLVVLYKLLATGNFWNPYDVK